MRNDLPTSLVTTYYHLITSLNIFGIFACSIYFLNNADGENGRFENYKLSRATKTLSRYKPIQEIKMKPTEQINEEENQKFRKIAIGDLLQILKRSKLMSRGDILGIRMVG